MTDDEVRRRRVTAQLLHRPGRRSVVDIVRHLGGVQAQVLPAAGLALRARTTGLTATAVDAARLEERSIVRTWAMRGTLHLVAADDVAWLVPLLAEPHAANSERRLRQEGVPEAHQRPVLQALRHRLRRNGVLSRDDVADALRRRGLRAGGQAVPHLMWLLASNGRVCAGPDDEGRITLVPADEWLGAGPPPPGARAERLAELAVRYLRAHAPATPADLAAWSGLRTADVERAWRSIGDRLVEVATARGPMWRLRSVRSTRPAHVVRLLPEFDEFLLGWRDRDLLVDDADRARVNRGGGWVHPVVLDDGRVTGTWRRERRGERLAVAVERFRTFPATARAAVRAEARDVGRFLERPATVSWHPAP